MDVTKAARVVILGKPGCHLCDEAEALIARVCAEVGADWAAFSILDDPELTQRYFELIPVTFVDGVQHDRWGVDEARLRAALQVSSA